MKYEIKGDNLPVVICQLEANEMLMCESGAMSWMSPNMQVETIGGGAGKAFGRLVSGEHLFQNRYTAKGGPGLIAFASSFPGSIRAIPVTPDKPVILQKKAYLASAGDVQMSIHFRKKLGSGIFGGEGFIMQKIEGNGIVFIEVDGSVVEYELQAGQQMVLDTGYLAMMDSSVSMDIVRVKGVKNMLFGGEGLFNTVVTGPGHIMLQTMPVTQFASQIAAMLPDKG